MKLKFIIISFLSSLFLISCSGTGETIQSNSTAITILDRAGGYGDRGSEIAETHCRQYGKVAILASESGPTPRRKYSYLCK
jgi:hypothetical protein